MNLLTVVILSIAPLLGFSQSDTEKDAAMRSVYASFYIDEVRNENFVFVTPLGHATGNLIVKAFRDQIDIPDITSLNLEARDKVKIDKLISKLKLLKASPPSWAELFELEAQHLIKWDKATHRMSIYKSTPVQK
jgi:hypothetical protein